MVASDISFLIFLGAFYTILSLYYVFFYILFIIIIHIKSAYFGQIQCFLLLYIVVVQDSFTI